MERELMVHSLSSNHRIRQDFCTTQTSQSETPWCRLLRPSTPAPTRYQSPLPRTSHRSRNIVLYSAVLTSVRLTKRGACDSTAFLSSNILARANATQIGQAMRIALAQGMHTDMPVENLGDALVQRCRKIWWTVYILDRQMTSLMGLPQSIRDDDISCQLPTFSGSSQRAAALNMQIKLARIYADIARSMLDSSLYPSVMILIFNFLAVYGVKGRLRKKFVVSIKTVLDGIASLAEELRQGFPLHADERFGGISRLPAHLHLLYYQASTVFTPRNHG